MTVVSRPVCCLEGKVGVTEPPAQDLGAKTRVGSVQEQCLDGRLWDPSPGWRSQPGWEYGRSGEVEYSNKNRTPKVLYH